MIEHKDATLVGAIWPAGFNQSAARVVVLAVLAVLPLAWKILGNRRAET